MKKLSIENYIQKFDNTLINTKVCSLIIALLPFISMIRGPIPYVDLGTTFILLLYLINIIVTRKIVINRSPFDGIFYYILIVTPITLLFQLAAGSELNNDLLTVILRWGKFFVSFYILFKSGILDHLSCKYLMKYIKYFSCISAIFVIIQRIAFSLFDIIIKNPLLPLATNQSYAASSYTNVSGHLFRPSGFFYEPAHMAEYMLLFFCYRLFTKDKMGRSDLIILVICLAGLIMTGSGIGILGIILLCTLWIILKYKNNWRKAIPVAIAFIVILILLSFTEHVQLSLARVFTLSHSTGGNAILSRIGPGYSLFWQSDFITKIIGTGFGNVWEDVYLNGWAYILNTLGLLGVFIVAKQLFGEIKTKILWQKIIGILFCGLLLGAQLFTAAFFAYYMIAVCCKDNSNQSKNPEYNGIKNES